MKSLPEDFIHQIRSLLPQQEDAFFDALNHPVTTSIRMNTGKPTPVLEGAENVPWCHAGYFLKERPSFIADPLFHAGAYYVQESSSMFLHHIYKEISEQLPTHPMVLDLCAAPGGKSTLLSGVLGNKGLLVSNEVIKSRVKILTENLERWGNSRVFITHNDPEDFRHCKEFFDVIVVDAPCSGEGMFRKDERAVEEWSIDHTELCSARQKRILGNVMNALKPGGFLIYSTCTFNTCENEENVLWMQQQFNLKAKRISIDKDWGIEQVNSFEKKEMYGYRFYFHHVKGEGLFISCLQKPSKDEELNSELPKSGGVNAPVKGQPESWLNEPDQFQMLEINDRIIALDSDLVSTYRFLNTRLKIIKAGITMGEMIKGELIPDHALALSIILNKHIPSTELALTDARKYLKKDVLPVQLFAEKGWQLVTYQHYPLGWVKVLPNRVNNYFPTHLRVIKDISYD